MLEDRFKLETACLKKSWMRYDRATLCDYLARPVGDYHWNNLSMVETKAILKRHAYAEQIIHVDTFLRSRFRCYDTHNKGAYTLIVSI